MLGWEVVPRIGIGDVSVSPHGVAIAVGYFVGTWLTARKARARGMDDDLVWNAAAASVIGAVVGARVAYVTGHFDEFESPLEWFQIWRGGLSIAGALLGAFAAGYLYTRRKQIDFFAIADIGMPFLALGIAIGRTGDLMIGDHLGKETSGWWGWRYKGGELISPPPCTYSTPDGCIETGMVVHQTALYDAVLSLAIFIILLALARKPRNRGFPVLVWASLYALGRLATDFTRVDKQWLAGVLEPRLGQGLTGSQLTAVVVLGVCAFFLIRYRGAPPASGEPARTTEVHAPGGSQGQKKTDEAKPERKALLEHPASTAEDPEAPEPPPRPDTREAAEARPPDSPSPGQVR